MWIHMATLHSVKSITITTLDSNSDISFDVDIVTMESLLLVATNCVGGVVATMVTISNHL